MAALEQEINRHKYLMMDHGGVLDGGIAMSMDDISPNDLILEQYNWGGVQFLKNGVNIVNNINCLINDHDYKLVFHSKNKYQDQIHILQQLQDACTVKGITFPKVYAMAVKDSDLNPEVNSSAPNISRDESDILVAQWGADDLNGKASVRRALESALRINEENRADHIIFDDGRPNFETPLTEGYQAHLIGGDGIALHVAIEQVLNLAVEQQQVNTQLLQSANTSVARDGFFVGGEWATFGNDFKAWVSENTRTVRVDLYGHIDTGTYWDMMGDSEHAVLQKGFEDVQNRVFSTLPLEFRAFLSEETQYERHNIVPKPTTEEYWNGLDDESKDRYEQAGPDRKSVV